MSFQVQITDQLPAGTEIHNEARLVADGGASITAEADIILLGFTVISVPVLGPWGVLVLVLLLIATAAASANMRRKGPGDC